MNTIQVVTIKPRTAQDPVGCIEYQVLDENNETVSHGHQVALPPETGGSTTMDEATALAQAHAIVNGLIEE